MWIYKAHNVNTQAESEALIERNWTERPEVAWTWTSWTRTGHSQSLRSRLTPPSLNKDIRRGGIKINRKGKVGSYHSRAAVRLGSPNPAPDWVTSEGRCWMGPSARRPPSCTYNRRWSKSTPISSKLKLKPGFHYPSWWVTDGQWKPVTCQLQKL